MELRRSSTDQRASLEDDSGRACEDVPGVDGTDPGVLPEAPRPLQIDLLQEHGARAALAGVRPEADHRHPADHRVRKNGPRIHEALAGRPDRFIKGWYVSHTRMIASEVLSFFYMRASKCFEEFPRKNVNLRRLIIRLIILFLIFKWHR